MPKKDKTEYVIFKHIRLPIREHQGRWRFDYADETAPSGWRSGSGKTKKLCQEAAHKKAVELASGQLEMETMKPEHIELCRQFVELDPTRADLEKLREWKSFEHKPIAECYAKYKAEFGEDMTRHQLESHRAISKFVEVCGDMRMRDVTRDDILDWINAHNVASKRFNHLRGYICHFFTWAKREGYIDAPNGLTPADRVPRAKAGARKAIRYLSSDEMKVIINSVDKDFLPWVIICGFSGVRSEEVRARHDKPPLMWHHVKRDQGVIEIPAEISKVRKRRLVPISPILKTWLDHINPPELGAIIPASPSINVTRDLGIALNLHFKRLEGWPVNVLRHSYLTYEAASRKDLPAIAIEAGTSVGKLNTNYVEATTEAEAKAYFALDPAACKSLKTKGEERKVK